MTDVRVGRLLAASLHQAIGDLLPQRLDFYEEWLRSEGLRDGSIGMAPISAVLGFLRTEEVYDDVVLRAGRLAAEWTMASMSPIQRRALALLPRALRVRAALRLSARIVESVCSSSRASTRVGRAELSMDVESSIFCHVREARKMPLCGFYAAAASELFARCGVNVRARVERCLAVDGSGCVIRIELLGVDRAPERAEAA
jgi:hypothetical protein